MKAFSFQLNCTEAIGKSISILLLGLQQAGKTTIALRLWKCKKELYSNSS